MIDYKKSFDLLRGTTNLIDLTKKDLDFYSIPENSTKNLFAFLKINEKRILHIAKEPIFKLFKEENLDMFKIVEFENYLLPITLNIKTEQIILNLKPFHVSEFSRINIQTLYAMILYGVSFHRFIYGISPIKPLYASAIINYYLSVMIRLFGKDYGLLGIYSSEIPKLKFLLGVYIYQSFFHEKAEKSYILSSSLSLVNYKEIKKELDTLDFSDIRALIISLSRFKVMPGLDQYKFTSKFLKLFGVNFLPSLEDLNRFCSSIFASTVKSSNLIPNFISKYNENEYIKIGLLQKEVFKIK